MGMRNRPWYAYLATDHGIMREKALVDLQLLMG